VDLLHIVSLVVFVGVYTLLSARFVHRAVAVLAGAGVLALALGVGPVLDAVLLEVLLVTAGLMVIGGALRRSGIAAWLALNAAKVAGGRPGPLLVLASLVTFVLGALIGPQAVLLVVPVVLVLAVELDVDALPFLVVLTWAGILGSATLVTAQPTSLWLASALGVSAAQWAVALAPVTAAGLVVSLLVAWPLFRGRLRVTNERRARVLEYDASKTVANGPLVTKTVTVTLVVALGFVAGGLGAPVPASVVALLGATLLMLLEGKDGFERVMGDLDPGVLFYYAGLFAVATLGTAGLTAVLVPGEWVPGGPLVLGFSAVLATLVDHGAVLGALLPFLQIWEATTPGLWVWAAVGTTLGSAVTVWGSTVVASAVGLASQGRGAPRWKDYTLASLAFGVVNLVLITGFLVLRG